ncbi:MAG TPA: hypothetical protein VK492_14625 [Chitinophagaceae bacterium]|nr:hypothetical protein [Chitinophagaceae bacterium]
MKKIFLLSVLCVFVGKAFAQKETFDIATYTVPKTWKKKRTESAVQFSKEDAAKGTYCLITLYKAVPGTTNSKENFDLAWTSVVKEMVNVSAAPEMQPSAKEDDWEVESGYAAFESDGEKGVALLVTSTGYNKMVNLIILTNTDAYETEMTSFIGSISLKKQTQAINKTPTTQEKNTQSTSSAKNDGFTFTTTNFDDGWTSTVQEDWVEVTKGNIKVLIHYPREGTIFPADPEPLTNAAWNILVAPRYSKLRDYKTAYITTYNRPYLGFGYLTENSTGKEVFVLLFRQGQTGWLEFVTPDKNSFIQQYKFDPSTIRWDSETDLLNPLVQMTNYNKFAVAAADFKGEWSSDFSGVQQLYNVYTGDYAGMNLNQSNETFQFAAGNTYNWKLIAVNGMVGNAKFAQVKSAGKFTVLNNWQVKFSDIERKPRTYNAHFSCIKGARLLHLLDAQTPGSGIYTVYGKK